MAACGKMTGWFIGKGFLTQEDYEVYVYCIDSLLGKLFFYLALMLTLFYNHISLYE